MLMHLVMLIDLYATMQIPFHRMKGIFVMPGILARCAVFSTGGLNGGGGGGVIPGYHYNCYWSTQYYG